MFFYYLRLAIKSFRKSPIISTITVLAIALGISVATTVLSLRHVMASNPLPHKSDQLFNIRLESWTLEGEFFGKAGEPPKHMSYKDMRGIMTSDIPTYQTGIGRAVAFTFPENSTTKPFRATIRLCHAQFFQIFEVPFQYGGSWQPTKDSSRERITVLSHENNLKLFNGEDSVGKTIRIGPDSFTIVGVLAPYRPTPQFYDALNNAFGTACDFFVPFDIILEDSLHFDRATQADSFDSMEFDTTEAFYTQSELHWIQFWVQLDTPNAVQAYTSFLDQYANEQKKLGRFPRELNNRVTPMMEWLEFREVAPSSLSGIVLIGLLFLLVCALNLMGLLLGKFVSKANVVGVRRALGASKSTIFFQHIAECLLVGVFGGVLGVLLTYQALNLIGRLAPNYFHDTVFRLDPLMLTLALGLSILASLIAGLYPAWRACNIQPAIQIKLQ